MKNLKTKIPILLILLLPVLNNNAQIAEDEAPIKINTLLLNVPVIASDKKGRNIIGLQKEDFIVTQNGERLPIEFFANEDAPINVAILVDTSGSTILLLDKIKDAARAFLKVLRPEDKAMVVSFDGKFRILSELISDVTSLEKAIDRLAMIQVEGSTMYDAIYKVVNNKFAEVKGRKAVILLTDGLEDSTRITREDLLHTLSESDTVIYPIVFSFSAVPKKLMNRYLGYLQAMTDTTVGKIYRGNSNFKKAFQNIADELRKQYLIGFYPNDSEDENLNNIDIKVNRENVLLRTKKTIRLKTSTQGN